jgi:hypothetical protein
MEEIMTRSLVRLLIVPTLVLAAACGGSDEPRLDEALKQDLWLASRTSPYAPYMSPLEQGYAYGAVPPGYQPQPYGGYQPAVARATPVVRRAPVATRTSTVARAPQRTTTVRNTKRDAIIGAAAGAAIGAVTSRDRLKGAVIGAVAGGVLGGVIGHNVDKRKVPVP